jgi:hypothetical protein
MKVALNLYTSAIDPANGKLGDIYVNTTTTNLRVHNGVTWIDLTPASDLPSLFYMHTHTYDGDVHTIDIENPITFTDLNLTNNTPAISLPLIVGVDGGTPSDNLTDPLLKDLNLFDGGNL